MIRSHILYSPERREFIQGFYNGEGGPHIAWTSFEEFAHPFDTFNHAARVADVIQRVDRVRIKIQRSKEEHQLREAI